MTESPISPYCGLYKQLHCWEPRKTRSVHASTGSARTEPVDLKYAVRTELVEVQGFSSFPVAAKR